MKTMKSMICVLLAIVMAFAAVIPAFAVDKAALLKSAVAGEAAQVASTAENPFKIEITTNKSKYRTTGVAKVTVKVTNTSQETIENVSAEALFDGLTPVGKDSKIKAETEKLNNGDSLSFSYKAMIASNQKGLSFFQRIILFFKYLFKRIIATSDNGFDNGRAYAEESKTISFGKYDTTNMVKVWYTQNGNTATSEEYEKLIEGVDIDELYEYDESDISVDEETGIEFLNDIVCITFEENCSDAKKAEIIKSINGKVVGGDEITNELYIKIKKSSYDELEDLCDRLDREPGVYLTTKEEFTISTMSVHIPNDPWSPDSSETSEYRNWFDSFNVPNENWNMVAINAIGAWLYQDYFSTVNIGVVDAGFSSSHPDLDIHVISKTDTPDDHGTHVAGIIGATANNHKGVTGLVWKKNIYAYDAQKSTDTDAKMSSKEIYNGIKELLKKGCKVINLSIGKSKQLSDSSQSLTAKKIKAEGKEASQKMIEYLKEYGDFIIVQASGNGASDNIGVDAINNGDFCSITKDNCYADKTFSYEYIKDRIIVVGNAMIDDESTPRKYICATSSNGGNQVDVIAPGTNILSTVLPYKVGEGTWYCRSMGGTSMAAPIVTGVASLVWSVNPSFTGKQVRDIVLNTAKAGGTKVLDNPASPTFYMVNAKLAVEEAIRQRYTTCTVKGSIVNQNGTALDNVKIRTVDTKTHTVRDFYSGSDGKYEFLLPVANYEFTYIKSGYGEMRIVPEEAFIANQTANLGELVMFAEKSNVSGTIKDKNTNAPIQGVSVEVIDNAAGTFDPIYTVETDENGSFSLALPVGSYSISFNHNDYEYYGRSLNVENANVPIELADILLSATGTTGDDGEIIDSGICGENVTWKLYNSGKLVIAGTGEMKDYTNNTSFWPWYSKSANISSIVIGNNVTSIGNYSFAGCSKITSITIPSSVKRIGNCAFYQCTKLTEITIPTSVTSIGNFAFYQCTELIEITIPTSVTSIGIAPFVLCTNLTSINVPLSNTKYSSDDYGVLYNKEKTLLIQYPVDSIRNSFVIPNSVTRVGAYSFYGCINLTNVIIPNTVTDIQSYAFYRCQNLVNILLPSNLINLGNFAFGDCSNLTSISIPNGLKNTGSGTFGGCTRLTSVTIPNSVTSIGSGSFSRCTSLTSLAIPDSVTGIGDHAFYCCTSLTNITIPDSVTIIGESAFYDCRSISSVSIPSGVTNIGKWAFHNCKNLTKIEVALENKYYCNDTYGVLYDKEKTVLIQYPVGNTRSSFTIPDTVTIIGENAFDWCENLTSITIPTGVTKINRASFYRCTGLERITIPDSVTSMGMDAFRCCSSMTDVIISNNITNISSHAFYECTSLTSITIPNNVVSIDSNAFYYCTNLTSIIIPVSVTKIDINVFGSCKKLKDVYYSGNQEQWKEISITGAGNYDLINATVHYNS